MANEASVKVKVDGEREFKQAMSNLAQSAKTLSSEMKAVTSSFTSETSASQKAAQTMETLKKQQANYETELKTLKQRYEEVASATGENSNQSLKLQESINKTQASLNKVNSELEDCKTTMEDAESAAGKLKTKFGDVKVDTSALSGTVDNLTSKFANLAKVGIETAVAGVTALATALTSLTKNAVSSYASTEQLLGGVSKIFGESASSVIKNANNAYKTAGLSANDYMETITSFSASLLQSLGGDTDKAVEYADRAVTDMADNANTYGTEISSIQNAYQGFAKSNYTMLDNLKLGYGGTKEEMQRLISDASEMTDIQEELGVTVDDSSLSFANCVNAISVMQTSLKITGTTAKEASTTIEGSVNSVKSAWENLLSGLASSDADITQLVSNLVDSAVTAAYNIIPAVANVFKNLPTVVEQIIPKVKTYLKYFKTEIKSALTSTITSIKTAFPKAASAIDGFTKSIKTLGKTVLPTVGKAISVVATNLETIVKVGALVLSTLVALKAAFAIQATITAVSSALALIGPAATAGSTAMAVLNGVMSANPFGAVAAAIGLVVAGVALLITNVESATTSYEDYVEAAEEKDAEFRASIQQTSDAIEQFNQSVSDNTQANYDSVESTNAEMSVMQSYIDQLSDCVDEEGNVKKGKEEIAEYIVSTLKDAYGQEIEIIDGKISNYKELCSQIDEYIEKLKAQSAQEFITNQYNDSYQQKQTAESNLKTAQDDEIAAYANQTEAVQSLRSLNEELERAKREYETLKQNASDLFETKGINSDDYKNATEEMAAAERRMQELKDKIDEASASVEVYQKDWQDTTESVKKAQEALDKLSGVEDIFDVSNFAMAFGEYDIVTEIADRVAEGFETAEEQATYVGTQYGRLYAKGISDSLAEGDTIDEVKNLLPKESEIEGDGKEIADAYLEEIREVLNNPDLTTEQITEKLKAIEEAGAAGKTTGEAFTDGVAGAIEDSEDKIKTTTQNTISNTDVSTEAEQNGTAVGQSYIDGVDKGLISPEETTKIQETALKVLSYSDVSTEAEQRGTAVGQSYTKGASDGITTTAMVSKAQTMVDSAKTAASNSASNSSIVGLNMSKSAANGISSTLLKTNMTTAVSDAKTSGNTEASSLKTVGSNMILGVISGMSYLSIANTLWGSVKSAINWVKTKLGIASPSKYMRDVIGKNMTAGIAVGLTAGTSDIIKASDKSIDAVMNNYKKNMNSVPIKINETFDTDSFDGLNYSINLKNQTNMQEAMTQALQNVSVVMDGERMGRFVNNKIRTEVYG